MEWLFKDDEYHPKDEKSKFIDKSIFSMVKVLSRIRRDDFKKENGMVYSINPTLKLLGVVLMLVLLSLSRNILFIGAVYGYIILSLVFMKLDDVKKTAAPALIAFLLTGTMLLPSIIMGNVRNSILIIIKVAAGVFIINILSLTTPWKDVMKSLKLFFVPDMFIFVMDVTIRYIFLLGDISLDMLYSLKKRSIGVNNKKYSSISGIMGNLFIKSKEMGDEMFSAMECRGFTGEYRSRVSFGIGIHDILYLLINIALIFLWIYRGR